ncbi:hypothetical protein [Bacillus sp. FJAT-45350]|uniref:hypothetical protein n=1 Tax=Bacillus sp. FJAT-45350 TaxID=2011014 RepID=UPI000BB6D0F5|nr:hypothetical protein [Bacillus sp. FJAT-45350]
MAKLSPPWITLWNEIKYSIGKDNEVSVLPIDTVKQPYVIKVITANEEKGRALATILTQVHQLGNIQILVVVENGNGLSYEGLPLYAHDEIPSIIRKALKSNQWFVDVIVKQVAPYPNAPTVFYPVFKKSVIQFFNDDLTDVYNNYNNVVADVFSKVLIDAISGISINCSTSNS